MKAQREISLEEAEKSKFYSYPAHKVLGVFDKPENLKKTLDNLKQNGFQESDIEVICNAGEIDFTGEEEKLWGRIKHSLEHTQAEIGYLDRFEKELNEGKLLLIVTAKTPEVKERVKEILTSCGGQHLTYFGSWLIENMSEAHEIKFDTHPYGHRRELEFSFEETLEKTREALKKEGFGVLTEIDMKEKLREKLGVDFRKYVILGACNPPLAHGALQEDLDIGLLLPCNVVVYEWNGGSVVAAIDASQMLSIAGNQKLEETAGTVNEKLRRAIENL